jgi:ubiquinone/menaquinone biosynthesis C-methylase UbiE
VSAWLARHGARVVGIDLSPGMVAAGRKEYPEVEFRQGDFLDLPARDAEFGAAVALYSIIHLEPGELTPAFAEMRRVLRPSGLVLVSFHIGAEVRHLDQWWDHEVDIDFRFLEPPSWTGSAIQPRWTPAAGTCWPSAATNEDRGPAGWRPP